MFYHRSPKGFRTIIFSLINSVFLCLLSQYKQQTIKKKRFILLEGEAQASLYWSTAVCAPKNTAAHPLPLGSVKAGLAVGDPTSQVSSHAAPVEVL